MNKNFNTFFRNPTYWRIFKFDRLELIRQKRHLQKLVDILRDMIEVNPEIFPFYQNYMYDLLNQINDIQLELEILCG